MFGFWALVFVLLVALIYVFYGPNNEEEPE
jgi:hypothetical protein